MNWYALAPGLAQFRGYRRSWLRGDIAAGLTVAAYLVPQVMAYATIAGLSPVVGLWASLLPLAIYAVLGSSRQLCIGPESTTALMTATALAPLAAGDAGRYAALAAMLAVLVGVFCFVGGLIRLGFLAELLSRPVLVGYMRRGGVHHDRAASSASSPACRYTVDGIVDSEVRYAGRLAARHAPAHGCLLPRRLLVVLIALARWLPAYPGSVSSPLLLATVVVAVFSL